MAVAKSTKRTLYAYLTTQGDLAKSHADSIVSAVEAKLDALVAKRKWASKDVWVVNQHEPPHWDLGLNLAVPAKASATFLDDVAAIATALGELHRDIGSVFVLGVHDAGSDETKDVATIRTDAPNLDELRASFGAALGIR